MQKILAVIFTLFLSATAFAQSAGDLNTKGYRLYKQKNYEAAIGAFQDAIKADPNHALAHYNLASTLSLMRKWGKICDVDAYRDVIREHLERAVALDPTRAQRMKADPDLEVIHDTVFYLRLTGTSPVDPKNTATILQNVSWYGKTGDGMFSSLPLAQIKFRKDLSLAMKIVEFGGTPYGPITRPFRGTYTINNRDIQIKLDTPLPKNLGGQKELKGVLTSDGTLKIEGPDTFTDDHEECSA